MSTQLLSRRALLGLGGTAIATATLGLRAYAAPNAVKPASSGRRRVLVIVLQRGAADGLSMVVPYADPDYYAARPTIAIPKPGAGAGAALKLDSQFGLHPALAGLVPAWKDGRLAVVQGVGPADLTRSHFDAQDYLESGTPGRKATEDGWLNRALGLSEANGPRAIALAKTSPRILAGHTETVSFPSIQDFRVSGGRGLAGGARTFEQMYAGAVDEALQATGTDAFEQLARIGKIGADSYPLQHGANYPKSELGKRLRQVSQMIQADLGVDAFVVDCGGWDTHLAQGASKGKLATRLQEFGDSIAAFWRDLKDRNDDICLVSATEFGRTVKENGTGGTDHGHGSAMLVLGGGVRGKRVVADWKGLKSKDLFEGRDLATTIDHRTVFSEVLSGHLGLREQQAVFPGFATPKPLGLFGS